MSLQSEALRSWAAGRAPAAAGHPGGGSRIVVGSGKGGTGTSTVAALLAIVAAAAGRDVLLVDGDENLGSLHFLLGVEPRYPLSALRGGEIEPRDLLVPVTPSLTLLPGGGIVGGQLPALTPAERRVLFRRVADLFGGYDVVVVDGGSRLDSVLSICSAGADRVVAVTAADRISVAATYALVKALDARIPGLPAEVLVNRTDEQIAARTCEDLRAAVGHFLECSVGFADSVPEDACLRAGIEAGMTVQDAAAGSPAAYALYGVCSHLLAQPDHSSGLLAARSK